MRPCVLLASPKWKSELAQKLQLDVNIYTYTFLHTYVHAYLVNICMNLPKNRI